MPSKRKTKEISSQSLESSLPNKEDIAVDTQKETLLSPEKASLDISTENTPERSYEIPNEPSNISIPDNTAQNLENPILPQVDEQKVPKPKKDKGTSAPKSRKSKKSRSEEQVQKNADLDSSQKDQSTILPQTITETPKNLPINTQPEEPISETLKRDETGLNYEQEYKKLRANFAAVKDDLKSKELTIKELKSEIESLRKKIKSYEKLEALDQGASLWKDAAYGMSQYIADKTGYTQSQILKKFGVLDD